jgi:hypothetical protein
MKFSEIKLGTGVYFENKQRDRVLDDEFEIESIDSPNGFILTHKKTKFRHFLSVYNIAYARISDERTGTTNQDRKVELPISTSTTKKAKKS